MLKTINIIRGRAMKTLKISVCLIVTLLCLISGCSPDAGGTVTNGSAEKPKDGPLECDWILKVDQTIPVTTDELTVNYTLVLIAQKTGGTDVYGTYGGAAYIGGNLDASNLSNSFLDVTGGFDIKAYANNLSFEIVPYDKEKYSRYGMGKDEAPVVPLVGYESMALISPQMAGSGIINPNVTGENVNAGYSDTASGSAPITMEITVKSGRAEVDVPSFNMGHSFEGLLIGEPLNSNDEYQQAMDKIEGLINSGKSNADESADDIAEGLDGLLGTIGSDLPLPDSFPVDEFQFASDANIINSYESEDGRNIRVIYGTNMTYEDIIELYAPLAETMDNKIDIDYGVMYLGSSDKYANISLMIMEDKSEAYKNMVTLEVLIK